MIDYADPWFWYLCMKTQVAEMLEAYRRGDIDHFNREVVDCYLVAIDALGLRGISLKTAVTERLEQNKNKAIYTRDAEYYRKKLERLEQGKNGY